MPVTNPGVVRLSASNSTFSGTVRITGGPNITAGTDASGVSLSAASQSVQTQNVMDLTLSGNTAGAMALVSSGTLTLAGGNNITVSQAGNAVTISGANAAGAQTGISGLANSQTTYTSGTVILSEQANVTINSSVNGASQYYRFSANPAQTGTQFSAGISGGNTSNHSGTVAGQIVLAGGNNVTLSGSTNGASESVTISAANQTAQTQNVHNVTLSGNTAGVMAQISSGTLTLAGGNNITLSQAGNAVTISGGAGAGGFAGGGISGGNTSGDTGSVTGRLIFAGNNNVTLSGSTNAGSMTISISVPNTAAQTGTQFSAGLSNIGNTSGNTGTKPGQIILAGGNNVTLSGSTNGDSITVTVSGPNTAAQTGTQGSFGLSNIGNTSGDTGTVAGRLVLAGGNNVTLSGSTNGVSETITISAGAGGGGGSFSAGMSNLGNTAGTSGTVSGQVVFVGTDDFSLSQSVNGASATISLFGGGQMAMVGGAQGGIAASAQNVENASILIRPLQLDGYVTAHTAALPMWCSSGATGSTAGVSWALGVYTLNASTLSLATSCSSTSSWTSGSNASNNWSGVSGYRQWPITNQTWNFTPGDYVIAMWVRTTNAGSYAHMADSGPGSAFSGYLGSTPNVSQLIKPYWGKYSASTAGPLPNSMGIANLANTLAGANERMADYMFYNSTWGVT